MVSVPFLSRLLIASCLYSKSWISRFVWDRLTVTNIITEPPAFRGRLQIYYSHSAICLRLFIPNILLQIPTLCFCWAGPLDIFILMQQERTSLNTFIEIKRKYFLLFLLSQIYYFIFFNFNFPSDLVQFSV